jgi:uncharacterized membrane protein
MSAADPTPEARPFVVPCSSLAVDAPRRWLRLGWRDLRRAPGLSLTFGLVIVAMSVLVSVLAWSLGRFALLAALLSGFVFVAPLVGVGLYCVSRDLAAGRQPALRRCLSLSRRVVGQAAVFALCQLVIVLLWSRAGMMVTAFVPVEEGDWSTLLAFLLVGSAVGSIFAAITFAVSAFSLPMVADRDVDMVTACVSSIRAVLCNKRVMLSWAALIVLLTAAGFATAFIGLAVVMPWLAFASWHAYREAIDASAWPVLE